MAPQLSGAPSGLWKACDGLLAESSTAAKPWGEIQRVGLSFSQELSPQQAANPHWGPDGSKTKPGEWRRRFSCSGVSQLDSLFGPDGKSQSKTPQMTAVGPCVSGQGFAALGDLCDHGMGRQEAAALMDMHKLSRNLFLDVHAGQM